MVGCDQVASDFRLCKWPPPLNSLVDEDLARYFDELNSKEFPSVFSAEQDKCQVITFSHFLPRYVVLGGVYTHGHLGQSNWVGTLMYACLLSPCFPWKQESKMSVVQQLSFLISTKDLLASSWSFSVSCIKIDPFFFSYVCRFELCPEKRMLFYPNLPKVVGSDWLEARVRSIHGPHGSETACHVFGHTHFCWDATLDGIRWAMDPASQTICFVQKVLVKFLMGFPWWAVLFRSSFYILWGVLFWLWQVYSSSFSLPKGKREKNEWRRRVVTLMYLWLRERRTDRRSFAMLLVWVLFFSRTGTWEYWACSMGCWSIPPCFSIIGQLCIYWCTITWYHLLKQCNNPACLLSSQLWCAFELFIAFKTQASLTSNASIPCTLENSMCI